MKRSMLIWLLIAAAGFAKGDDHAASEPRTSVSKWISVDGVMVHYRQAGNESSQSPPLLLIHGWMGSSYDFADLMKAFPVDLPTVAPDLPGSGMSQKTGITFSTGYFVEFIRAFMQQLGISRVVLVGHSMGGGISVHFAVRYPDMVSKLILIDPDGLSGEEGFFGTIRKLGLVVDVVTLLNNRLAIRIATRVNVFHNPEFITQEYLDSIAATSLSPEGRKAQAQITKQVLGRAPVDDLLPSIQMPTLVIWGEEDRLLGSGWAKEFVRRIPHAQLSMIPESGHMPQIEAAPRVSEEILDFLHWYPKKGNSR